jgi:hypothetical protein
LAKVEFDIDDFEAKYYLVKLDNNWWKSISMKKVMFYLGHRI